MTHAKLSALSKDLDALHAKHIAHPAVLLIQPMKGRQILSVMVGQPSREWLCHVIDNELKQIATYSFLMPPVVN